jgi:hypothetical protein
MTRNWIIIRTQYRKEDYCAGQIARLGFDAWVPTEIVRCRGASRRITKTTVATKPLPVLPRTLFAAVSSAAHGDLMKIRHLVAVERGPGSEALEIPHNQILVFRDEIDRLNKEVLALAAIQTRKHRAKWRDMREALAELVKGDKQAVEIVV